MVVRRGSTVYKLEDPLQIILRYVRQRKLPTQIMCGVINHDSKGKSISTNFSQFNQLNFRTVCIHTACYSKKINYCKLKEGVPFRHLEHLTKRFQIFNKIYVCFLFQVVKCSNGFLFCIQTKKLCQIIISIHILTIYVRL